MSSGVRALIIVAPDRAAVAEIDALLGESDFEIHLDRRQGERRTARGGMNEERRRGRDRRSLDVSAALQTTGWALIPPALRVAL